MRRRGSENLSLMQEGFTTMRGDYSAAKRSGPFKKKRTGVPLNGAGADYHTSDADYLWMGEVARDLDRNDPVIGQLIDRHVDNVLGGGFTPNPNTGDDGANKELKARATEEFADPAYCDVAGELSFYDQERMVLRETAAPGDVFVLPMFDDYGTVQIVESHLCRQPTRRVKRNIVLGVEMDPDTRRRQNFFFCKEPIDPLCSKVNLDQLEPRAAYTEDDEANVFHVYRPKRPTQTRGISPLAPVIDMAGIHDDLEFAALLKAQLNAFFLLVRNRKQGWGAAKADSTPSGVVTDDPQQRRRIEKLAPGSEIYSDEAEEVTAWNPNIPNAEFFPHVKLILTFIGVQLGMPLVLTLLDASESNFSAYRGALDQARLGFRSIQRQLQMRFHRQFWRMKVRHWAQDDAALAALLEQSKPGGKIDVFRHGWTVPAWPYIEPNKDAAADLLRESNMQSSPTRIRHERGVEWTEIVAETVRDRKLAIETALEASADLNKRFKLKGTAATTWRDFAPLPAPERMAVSMQVGDPEEKPKQVSNAQRKAA